MKIEENKELEKNREIKKVNVDGDFDNNLFGFIVEEKFKLLNYAFDGIVSFSTKPLRFATYTGILTSFIAFIYLIVILVKTFTTGIDTPGYASLMCVMLFLGGIQLIFLGIIGEYLGKTYNETKRRPIFIARERIGFDEDFL